MTQPALLRAVNFWHCDNVGVKHFPRLASGALRLFWCHCFEGCNIKKEKVIYILVGVT